MERLKAILIMVNPLIIMVFLEMIPCAVICELFVGM